MQISALVHISGVLESAPCVVVQPKTVRNKIDENKTKQNKNIKYSTTQVANINHTNSTKKAVIIRVMLLFTKDLNKDNACWQLERTISEKTSCLHFGNLSDHVPMVTVQLNMTNPS